MYGLFRLRSPVQHIIIRDLIIKHKSPLYDRIEDENSTLMEYFTKKKKKKTLMEYLIILRPWNNETEAEGVDVLMDSIRGV